MPDSAFAVSLATNDVNRALPAGHVVADADEPVSVFWIDGELEAVYRPLPPGVLAEGQRDDRPAVVASAYVVVDAEGRVLSGGTSPTPLHEPFASYADRLPERVALDAAPQRTRPATPPGRPRARL